MAARGRSRRFAVQIQCLLNDPLLTKLLEATKRRYLLFPVIFRLIGVHTYTRFLK